MPDFEWFVTIGPRDMPHIRLFCFPHAGGSAAAYASWPATLPQHIEVVAVQPPGRASRLGQPLPDDLDAMATTIADGIQQQSDVPFAFFGHSFGALIAFEVARKLEDRDVPGPLMLIASAHSAPQLHATSPSTWLHGLTEDEFVKRALARGYIPEEAAGNPELLEVLSPVLRADLRLDEIYKARETQAFRACAVVAFGGSEDPTVDVESLAAWAALSGMQLSEIASLQLYSGGHFFLETNPEVLPAVESYLIGVLQTRPKSAKYGVESRHLADPSAAKCVHVLFDEQAARTPGAIAIVDLHRQLTYAELKHESELLARHLQHLGITKGDIVGSYTPHRAEYIIANLAIFKAGGAIFPLETNYPADLLAELIEMSGISVVLTMSSMKNMIPPSHQTDDHCFCLEGAWVEQLEGSGLPPIEDSQVGLADRAYVTMTSGSTGRPKGVVNAHIGATHNFLSRFDMTPYDPGEREGLNVFFIWECMRPILQGATAYIIPDEVIVDPRALVTFLHENEITRLQTPAQLIEAVLEYPDLDLPTKLKRIRYWYQCGEPVPARVVAKWIDVLGEQHRLVNCYGSWEALDHSVAFLDSPVLSGSKFAPVGLPLPSVNIYIVDEELQLLPSGCPGEMLIEAPGLAIEYLHDPEKTAERFRHIDIEGRRVRVYRTGDRGRVLPTGELECMGRIDSTVKIRGFKVSVPFVESTLKEHPLVGTAAVMPQMDNRTNIATSLAAYVVGTNGTMSDAHLEELQSDLKTQLPPYAFPQHWVRLEQLPTKGGESRKLDRQALPPVDAASTPRAGPTRTRSSASSRVEEVILGCWATILGNDALSCDDNFFEVGGHSLLAAKLVGELNSTYGMAAHVLDIYDHPTVASLAQHLSGSLGAKEQDVLGNARGARRVNNTGVSEVAVIGLGGCFPGAMDVGAFWENLKAGHDSLRRLTPAELDASGVPADVFSHPDYVLAGQVCDDVDKFDSAFWGIGKLEAEIMDPQHRVFMEVSWHAIEDSGYPPRTGTPTRCGVFAACGIDGYLIHHLNGGALKDPMDPGSLFLTEVASEKDYIATRVAYALDLKGPTIVIQSACSSGLVAVAQAAQSLATNACDMAIAGASSLTFPNTGFLFDENLVYSRDGHVRPFDQGANGTTFGDSVGAVVLKVLDDAVDDNDRIYAVLSGSAVTNDGGVKAGYSAPAASGQSAAIVAAHQAAQVNARDISYVECHATATNIGDAIEIRGLSDAFAKSKGALEPQFCALGSVKGNIGHANCAAGLTGLVKTVLCLHHRQLVPTAHFSRLSDKIPIRSDSPFYVHSGLSPWIPDNQRVRAPLRAGVSSFGIGGTNAHAILREAMELRDASKGSRCLTQVMTLSAKSIPSLSDQLLRLADYVGNPETNLADTAFTLHTGREQFAHRAAVVCDIDDRNSAKDALQKYKIGAKSKANPGVVLCFPGQGSQYISMGRGLYETEEIYRKHFDACAELLLPIVGVDIRAELFFDKGSEAENQAKSLLFSSKPEVVQTSIFTVEYALAKLMLRKLGIQPIAMVGHSIGEYAAACVSGVLKLEDALELVATRATAMSEGCERGCMLSAKMSPADARSYVSEQSDVWIACENSPENVVFSCTAKSAPAVSDELCGRGIKVISLPVTHGFHSEMVRPAADAVAKVAIDIKMQSPSIPLTSNVTGSWLPQELPPGYWAEHIVKKVRFLENIETVAKWKPTVFIECGPGTTLCTLIDKSFASITDKPLTIAAMRHPKDTSSSDEFTFANMVANLWVHGIPIDWSAFHQGEHVARCSVPGYSFEKVSHWKHPDKSIYVTSDDPSKKRRHKNKQKHKKQQRGGSASKPTSLVRYGNHALTATTAVYCFTYAGGSSLAFMSWARDSPTWLDVVAIELPGRGSRSAEQRPASHAGDRQLLDEIAADIQKDTESSKANAIAFVGLSMGCLTAIEVQKLLPDLRVAHTFLAGRSPPQPDSACTESLDQSTIAQLNLAPAEIQNSEEWESHFLPMLVADLEADMRASNRVVTLLSPELVRGDVEIFCGLEDTSFATDLVGQWQACTQGHFDQHFFVGGHDFLKNCAAQIFRRIENTLCGSQGRSRVELVGTLPSHSTLLSKVAWERPKAKSVTSILPGEMCVLTLGHTQGEITDQHLNAVRTAAGLVVVLSTENGQEAPATPPTAPSRSGHESTWMTEDQTQCMQLLHLVNRLVDIGAGGGKLTLVCESSVRGAMTIGASKVIPLEFPEFFVQRIFIQTGTAEVGMVEQAVHAAVPYVQETDILVSFDRWRSEPSIRVARLQPLSELNLPADPTAIQLLAPNAAYVVTGGLGGVGSAVVDWLVEVQKVAPHCIYIVSRRELTQPHKHRGINVLQADVSDLSSLLASSALSQLSNVGGIFHLSGVLDDGLIGQMTLPRLAKCCAPKVAGAINLVRLAEENRWQPEFMLCFSSTSSLAGYAAQANYCAANQVLDHLGQGWSLPSSVNTDRWPQLKMITVNWGAWGEAGMAAVGTKAHQLSIEEGQVPLSTQQGLRCLAGILLRALDTDAPMAQQFAACSCEWPRTPWADLPLITHVTSNTAASVIAAADDHRADNNTSDSSDSSEDEGESGTGAGSAVVTFLKNRVPRWDTSEPLAAIGLDSLDLVSMRNNYNKQFGTQLGLQLFTNPQKTLGELLRELENACQ